MHLRGRKGTYNLGMPGPCGRFGIPAELLSVSSAQLFGPSMPPRSASGHLQTPETGLVREQGGGGSQCGTGGGDRWLDTLCRGEVDGGEVDVGEVDAGEGLKSRHIEVQPTDRYNLILNTELDGIYSQGQS